MRKYHLTLNAKNINYTDVLAVNCDAYIVQIPLYISMTF